MYIVCSGNESKKNGYVANAVFQVTAEPAQFAVCCNKNNYSNQFLAETGAFSVSILSKDADSKLIGDFGYHSGKDIDKFASVDVNYGETGVPIVTSDSIAVFECKIVNTVDVGTHIMYIGELISAEKVDEKAEPLTYDYYRRVKKGASPKNAPTYFDHSKIEQAAAKPAPIENAKQYRCNVCGYIYDDTNESVKFEDLPDDWECPICGISKSEFSEME